MNESIDSRIRRYCAAHGVVVPMEFDRFAASRFAAVDVGHAPPRLVDRTWFTVEDFLAWHGRQTASDGGPDATVEDSDSQPRFRLFDFADGVALHFDGGVQVRRGDPIRYEPAVAVPPPPETAKPGRCAGCGYDRTGIPAYSRCPECGAEPIAIDPGLLAAERRIVADMNLHHRNRVAAGFLGVMCGAGFALTLIPPPVPSSRSNTMVLFGYTCLAMMAFFFTLAALFRTRHAHARSLVARGIYPPPAEPRAGRASSRADRTL